MLKLLLFGLVIQFFGWKFTELQYCFHCVILTFMARATFGRSSEPVAISSAGCWK